MEIDQKLKWNFGKVIGRLLSEENARNILNGVISKFGIPDRVCIRTLLLVGDMPDVNSKFSGDCSVSDRLLIEQCLSGW